MKVLSLYLSAALLLLPAARLSGQETENRVPVPYGPAEFPEWQKDLRRAEILSFGALPFITFLASIYYDVYRYIDNDSDERYLPWPMKKTDIAIPLTEDEQKNIFYTSAGISVGVALFDYGFRFVMRTIRGSKAEKLNRSAGEPIRIEPATENEPITGGEE